MVAKKTPAGREYEVQKGRWLVWHADVWEDEGEEPFDVTLPLRMKARFLWDIGVGAAIDIGTMRALLESIAPDAEKQMGELDLNDFQAMFTAWQFEYELLNGASTGESRGSSS